MQMAQAMFDLVAHPEYIEPLRDELRQAKDSNDGWSKASISKLRKMDSFIKESQRFRPPGLGMLLPHLKPSKLHHSHPPL